jgi:hypothetical protein
MNMRAAAPRPAEGYVERSGFLGVAEETKVREDIW